MNLQSLPTLVFFGTHDFAAYILEKIILSKEYNIINVVTQPGKPVGRNQETLPSPVKKIAEQYNIPALEPATLKNYTDLPQTDLFIVCQYGKIIPQAILDIPTHGAINIHTSLLPKYRGASPIQAALIQGETETGATIMLMDALLDHGPILTQEKIAIAPDDTYETLSHKMAPLAASTLLKTLPRFLNKTILPQEQTHNKATACKILDRDDGRVDFTKTSQEIYNLYRGTYPWPGIWTLWQGKRLKLLKIQPADFTLLPGLVEVKNNQLFIGTATTTLEILELQLEGKKAMDTKTFLNGYNSINNKILPS